MGKLSVMSRLPSNRDLIVEAVLDSEQNKRQTTFKVDL